MQELIFRKNVSRGTRFNQIYIPKEFEILIHPGDLVEVRLIESKAELYFHNIKQLSNFKKELIKKIFQFLQRFNVEQVFLVGSFLYEQVNYNDIDLVIVSDKTDKKHDEKIHEELSDEFNLKFHLLSIKKEQLDKLLRICPLTKGMFDKFISNKEFKVEQKKTIDKNHLLSLLMMPEDLLEIELNSRAYYEGLRRLITIKNFLTNTSLASEKINEELKKALGDKLYPILKNNESIDENILSTARVQLSKKIEEIKKLIK